MIEKFRHGGEVSSEHLNQIVEAVNNILKHYTDIDDIKTAAKESLNTLDIKLEEVFEELKTMPQLKELYASILLARDSVDWVEIPSKEYTFIEDSAGSYVYDEASKGFIRYTEDMGNVTRYERMLTSDADTEQVAKCVALLTGHEGDKEESAQRLTIIRGRLGEDITLDKPALKDKQILLGYSSSPAGTSGSPIAAIFFDVYIGGELKRLPITASGSVQIVAEAPTFRLVKERNGEEVYLEMHDPQTNEITRSVNLKGATGRAGVNGRDGVDGHTPEIKVGPNGNWVIDGEDTGVRAKGKDGIPGADGASLTCSIQFSDYADGRDPSDIYINQTYMGIKFYKETASQTEISSIPRKWIRISGDTLYPSYDSNTGILSFSTHKPNGAMSFYVRGLQGKEGPAGKAPNITFKRGEEDIPITPIEVKENPDGETLTYVYDASLFTGPVGPKGETGEPGKTGPEGPEATFNFKVQAVDYTESASVEDITTTNSRFSYEYLLKVPKGKPGDNGLSIKNCQTLDNGRVILNLTNGDPADPASIIVKTIDLGVLKGPKGDKGDPATISIKGVVESKNDLPTDPQLLVNGDAYIVKKYISDTDYEAIMYICTDSSQTTVDKIYVELGNIRGEKGATGENGEDGRGILEIVPDTVSAPAYTETGAKINSYIIRYTDGNVTTIKIADGAKGATGSEGPAGQNARISISSVDTLEPGSNATVENITPAEDDPSMNVNLKFGIPAGTTIHSQDTGTPDNGIGRNNDFFLVKSTGNLYKKQNNAWVLYTQIKGVNGATIRTSFGTPSDNVGSVNDLCIDMDTGNLWYKASGVWSRLGNLCLQGKQGEIGPKGADGSNIVFLQQDTAPTSTVGYNVGDIIITLYSYNVYTLIEEETTGIKRWTHKGSTKGDKGETGDAGHTPQILINNGGYWEIDGVQTQTKAQGPKGDKGDALKITVKKRLNSIAELETLPSYEQGDAYLIIETEYNEDGVAKEVNNLYVCLAPEQAIPLQRFTNLGNIKGEKGDKGEQGNEGLAAQIRIHPTQPVIELEEGETPTVVNTGTVNAAVLQFGLPKGKTGATGADGKTPTIKINSCVSVNHDQPPVVKNTGSETDVLLDFEIPAGAPGKDGVVGKDGVSPYIGSNGKWFDANGDTGVTAQGPSGNDGADGTKWFYGTALSSKGSAISTTISGSKVGDYYLNNDKGYIYCCTATNTWKFLICIKPIQSVSTENGTVKIVVD